MTTRGNFRRRLRSQLRKKRRPGAGRWRDGGGDGDVPPPPTSEASDGGGGGDPPETSAGAAGAAEDVDSLATDDPLDVRCVITDIVEILCHEVLVDRDHRIERSNQLNYFLDRLGGNVKHSRLNSHIMLAAVMFEICARDPHRTFDPEGKREASSARKAKGGMNNENGNPVIQERTNFTPLADFTVEKWEDVLFMFQEVRDLLVRADANEVVIPRRIEEFPTQDEGLESESNNEDEGDAALNENISSNKLFTENYEDMVQAFRFQQSLSHFRSNLEAEISRRIRSDKETLHVQPKDLVAFEKFVSSNFEEDSPVRLCLESLVIKGEKSSHQTRSCGLALKPLGLLKEMMRGKNFDLERFQRKVEKLLLKWYEVALSKPTLAELGYGKALLPRLSQGCAVEGARACEGAVRHHQESPSSRDDRSDKSSFETRKKAIALPDYVSKKQGKESNSAEGSTQLAHNKKQGEKSMRKDASSKLCEVKALAQARQTLREDVRDPLEESCALAAEATSASTALECGRDSQKGPAARAIPMPCREKRLREKVAVADSGESEDDESIEESEEGGTATLSELPERAKIRHGRQPHSKKARTAPSPPSGARPKKRFTDEEKSAIKIGVERFGFGRWAKIKEYYSEELRNRTPVNIKDCYRTMKKHNQV